MSQMQKKPQKNQIVNKLFLCCIINYNSATAAQFLNPTLYVRKATFQYEAFYASAILEDTQGNYEPDLPFLTTAKDILASESS